jgi:hypothetical protein
LVLGGRSKKAGLGSGPGLRPEAPKPPPDLKRKQRRPAVFPFEVGVEVAKASWLAAPKSEMLLKANFWFWPITFSRARFHCPASLPLLGNLFLFGSRQLALELDYNAPIKMREKAYYISIIQYNL